MRRYRISLFAWLAVWFCAMVAAADDFRVETKVFGAKDKAPRSQNLTLFHAGYVYDYLPEPERVAVFDRAHGRFILLDPVRKLKVEIKTDDVLVFSKRFHAWAAKNQNAFMQFAADPQFEVKFTEDGDLTLASPYLTYTLETVPARSEERADQYREFCDWYARFNAMIHVGSTPPFPRLAVNRELATRTLVPTSVSLTIPAQPTLGVRAVSLRTEHHVSWRLLQRDLDKISETANHLAVFETVTLAEFQGDDLTKR